MRRLAGLDLPESKCGPPSARSVSPSRARVTASTVPPPTWRPDIDGKADLVEEVVRIAGLDRIAPQPLPRLDASVLRPILTPIQKRTRLAKRLLARAGWSKR